MYFFISHLKSELSFPDINQGYSNGKERPLFVSPLPGLWAWFYLVGLPFGLYVGSGFGLSLLCPGCGLGFIWLVCLLASGCVCSGLIPLSYFEERCCPVFVFSGGLGLLYSFWLFMGLWPFGNKFLIIKKKKRKSLPSSSGTCLSSSISITTKSTGKINVPTLIRASSSIPSS